MKNYDKNIEHIQMQTICMDGQCLKKLPVNGFKWVNDVSRYNEDFIKNYNENADVGYFLEVDVESPKKLFGSHQD